MDSHLHDQSNYWSNQQHRPHWGPGKDQRVEVCSDQSDYWSNQQHRSHWGPGKDQRVEVCSDQSAGFDQQNCASYQIDKKNIFQGLCREELVLPVP